MTDPDRSAEGRSLIERYLDRFNESDFEAALACYNLPFTWFFDATPFCVTTQEQFVSTMRATKGKLVRDGLDHSSLIDCSVRMVGAHAAFAEVTVSRRRADGSEMEVAGGTYLLHDRGNGWRLAAFVGHPPAKDMAGTEP